MTMFDNMKQKALGLKNNIVNKASGLKNRFFGTQPAAAVQPVPQNYMTITAKMQKILTYMMYIGLVFFIAFLFYVYMLMINVEASGSVKIRYNEI